LTYTKLENFNRVYSGHIHYSQNFGKIRMLGSPYQLTRADAENTKAILLLDLQTEEETLFKNTFSPQFKKYSFTDILQTPLGELVDKFSNNFVEIAIDPEIAVKTPLGIMSEMITSPLKMTFLPLNANDNQLDQTQEILFGIDGKNFSVMDLVEEYVKTLGNMTDLDKSKIVKALNKVHTQVISITTD